MSIGQSAGACDDLATLSARLDRLEWAGVEVVELMPDRAWVLIGGEINHRRLTRLQAVLADRPLRYTMHAPAALNLFDRVRPDLHERLFQSSIEVAAAIGAEILVYDAGRRLPGRVDVFDLEALLAHERSSLRRFGGHAAEHGIRIAVENLTPAAEATASMPDTPLPYGADLRRLAEHVAAVDNAAVGICLDIGHAYLFETVTRGFLLEAVAAAAPWTAHLHIHDNFGWPEATVHMPAQPDRRAVGEADLHLPIGWGTIPFETIFDSIAFPRAPIALGDVTWIDDEVLAETAGALRDLAARGARLERELVGVR
jgi:sugar phosphate isomerase/epimerase